MNTLLEIRDLQGGYVQYDILQGINLTIQSGETVGIIGLNGSGKSTLAAAIMNMLPYRKGDIYYQGEDITSLPTWKLPSCGIAMMQQGGRVFPSLSVMEHLELVLGRETKTGMERLAEMVPLLAKPKHKLRHMMADHLSGGQKHQLALAMTLALNPSLMILDEPSAGLTPRAIDDMYLIIDAICRQEGTAILLIEQVVAKAVEHSNRCLLIQLGTIAKEFIHPDIKDVDEAMFASYIATNQNQIN